MSIKRGSTKETFERRLHRNMLTWLFNVLLLIILLGPDACSVKSWCRFAQFWMVITLCYTCLTHLVQRLKIKDKV